METKKKPRKNDPERVSRAWLRFGAALVCAFILLAVTSFGFVRLLRGGTPILKLDRLVPGDYVQQDVSIVLDNIATGYRGEKATEVYGVVPLQGKFYVFCFPERWFVSELAVREQTDAWLGDPSLDRDQYMLLSGTAQTLPDSAAKKARAWLARNEDTLRAIGMIPAGQATEDCIDPCVIYVDRVGGLPFGTVILLTAAAFLLVLYALAVLLRIAVRGYPPRPEKAPKKEKEKLHGKA